MADNHDLLRCPLCEGHGEIGRSEIIELLRSQRLENKMEALLSATADPKAEPVELVTVAATGSEARDFRQDVHCWNPQLPMWRRSPKE